MNPQYRITVTDVDERNVEEKYSDAVEALAKAMGVSKNVDTPDDERAEKWQFKCEEELANKWSSIIPAATEEILTVLALALDLPSVRTLRKSDNDPLTWRGKIVFHPETGKPIKKVDFDKLIKAIERFMNRKLKDADKRMVLEPRVLARLLSQMAKKQSTPDDAMKSAGLHEIMQRDRGWGAYSATLGNYIERYNVTPIEADQVYLAIQKTGEYIVDTKWKMVKAVKLAIIEGTQQRKSKGQIAQDLFDRLGSCNRDWRRIADTETADNFNNAYLRTQSGMVEPGKKVYFKRLEAFDDHVCKYCLPYRGKIALWSEAALPDDSIQDEWTDTAIWEGKSNYGRKAKDYWLTAGPVHPNCRGSWVKWIPPVKGTEDAYRSFEKKQADIASKRRATRDQMIAEGWKDTSKGWEAEFRRRMGGLN